MHPATAPVRSACPRLTFVHDLIPLTQPRDYSPAKRIYYRTVLRWSLRAAARVLVDSESTRRDCERLLGLPADQMRVVHGGVAEQYRPLAGQEEESPPRPYLLYVGNKRPHKNVDRLIEAFALLQGDVGIDCDLVSPAATSPAVPGTDGGRPCAGRSPAVGGACVLSEEALQVEPPRLYRGAAAFVLPAGEVSACLLRSDVLRHAGVALKTSSLPEVVGDGGLLLADAEPAWWRTAPGGAQTIPCASARSARPAAGGEVLVEKTARGGGGIDGVERGRARMSATVSRPAYAVALSSRAYRRR
jgi:glycosyltransferase involved in cell wall biosynthesis